MVTRQELIIELYMIMDQFLKSDEKEIKFDCVSYDIIKEVLEIFKYKENEYPDTNGWQIDYSSIFKLDENELFLSGSMYYGDVSIGKTR